MMLRDWQFRRQVIPLVIVMLANAPLLVRGWRTDPLTGRFSSMHFLPHVLGVLLFVICQLLKYSNDYKGA
jgi:hypothetical protein